MRRADRRLAWRAGLVVAAALMLALSAARANAAPGESPTQFWVNQASAASHPARDARHLLPAARGEREATTDEGPRAILAEAARWLGSRNPTGKPGAWCAWFVSFVLERTGHRPLANGMAMSALWYGQHLPGPRVGALAVLSTRRGYARHVGIVEGIEGDRVELISGNWSHRVARALVSRRAIAAFIAVP